MSYYRKFIESFAKMSAVLTPAVTLSVPANVEWTEEMKMAFCKLREYLCVRVVLFVPLVSDLFCLYTNASNKELGRACM